jgi:hypothetical protein
VHQIFFTSCTISSSCSTWSLPTCMPGGVGRGHFYPASRPGCTAGERGGMCILLHTPTGKHARSVAATLYGGHVTAEPPWLAGWLAGWLTLCGRCLTLAPHTSAYLNCLISVLCSRLQKSCGR